MEASKHPTFPAVRAGRVQDEDVPKALSLDDLFIAYKAFIGWQKRAIYANTFGVSDLKREPARTALLNDAIAWALAAKGKDAKEWKTKMGRLLEGWQVGGVQAWKLGGCSPTPRACPLGGCTPTGLPSLEGVVPHSLA